jgi:hypothetical protein
MPRAKAAQRVAAANVTASLAALLSPARAEASRRNGAKSKGPRTAEGKARSAQNALKHGLRAQKFVVVGDEDPREFAAFEAALVSDLAPEGALQALLAGRIARAAWRLQRADQIEAELFARQMKGLFDDGDLGHALIRDGNGARAFDTLLRYRGAAQAELFRTLRTLEALQAEAGKAMPSRRTRPQPEAAPDPTPASSTESPDEPEARGNPGGSRGNPREARAASPSDAAADPAKPREDAPAAAATRHAPDPHHAAPDRLHASSGTPIGPEGRTNPGETTRFDAHSGARAA